MKQQNPNIFLIGLGAIGGAFAAQATDNGHHFSIICDEARKRRYEATPFVINGKDYHFNCVTEKGEQEVDLLLIAVKFHQLPNALEMVRPFVSDKTTIVSLLNGISSEEVVQEQLQTQNVLHAFVLGTDATKNGHQIDFNQNGKIVMGTPHKKREAILQSTVDCLRSVGIEVKVPKNIVEDMWWKLMVNAGMNQVSALHRIPYGVFTQNEDIEALIRMAMQEVITIAKAMHINLQEEAIEKVMELSKTWGPMGKTSMLQDIENERKTEVEIMGGEICRLGESLNIPTPINRFLYHSIRYIEATYLE